MKPLDNQTQRDSAESWESLKKDIDESAARLVAFLESNKISDIFRFPFSYSFPINSCQGTSLLFKFLLEDKYNIKHASIIKGKRRRLHEFHYWTELDGIVYDLSAHQFRGIQAPVIGLETSPLQKRFPIQVEDREFDFLDREEVRALHRGNVFSFE